MQKFKIHSDQYRTRRGGFSRFLNIYCERCGNHLLLYQKDGPGPLKRMYLDRVVAPEALSKLRYKKEIPNLVCPHCNKLIAIPKLWEKENRKAYALLAYTVIKKIGKGIYPPETRKLNLE